MGETDNFWDLGIGLQEVLHMPDDGGWRCFFLSWKDRGYLLIFMSLGEGEEEDPHRQGKGFGYPPAPSMHLALVWHAPS